MSICLLPPLRKWKGWAAKKWFQILKWEKDLQQFNHSKGRFLQPKPFSVSADEDKSFWPIKWCSEMRWALVHPFKISIVVLFMKPSKITHSKSKTKKVPEFPKWQELNIHRSSHIHFMISPPKLEVTLSSCQVKHQHSSNIKRLLNVKHLINCSTQILAIKK